jgi:hypothetical protein
MKKLIMLVLAYFAFNYSALAVSVSKSITVDASLPEGMVTEQCRVELEKLCRDKGSSLNRSSLQARPSGARTSRNAPRTITCTGNCN